jgi:uncharacterized membrane protein
VNHHNRFRLIAGSDHILLFLNIVFLMCVAFILFPTALLAEYIREEEYRITAVAVYSGTLAVIAVLLHHALALCCRELPPRGTGPLTLSCFVP